MLNVDGVSKSYRQGGFFSSKRQLVLDGISFAMSKGECLGIIGESGSGKSTLGRILLGIEQPDRGTVVVAGKRAEDRRGRAGSLSAVFQDYTSSINPYYTVEEAMMEPLAMRCRDRQRQSREIDLLLRQVGLNSSYRTKYPHELSGGEAQRVCIARAVAVQPECILLDEAVSSLDGAVQVQVLELLKRLKTVFGIGYIFITHDIQAAAYMCDRILFLHNGRIEETVPVEQLKLVRSAYAKKLLRMVIA